jgi:pyruvate/2-oxoglutarate/acetoin dehydrogenase E1 component
MYCQIVRGGSDITVVGWGAQMTILDQACIDAAKVRIESHEKNKLKDS